MRHKTATVEIKSAGDAGEFVALASVFGNVDLVGDRMLPGAFTKTLERWRESGDPIPVVLSHQWDDPMAYVGKADPNKVVETEQGLVVNGTLDTSTPVSKQVHKLMKDGLIKGWSFGYTVPEGGEEFKNGANEVSEVDLIEVGPTLKGANPEARSLAVKALEQTEDDEPTVYIDPDGKVTRTKGVRVIEEETSTTEAVQATDQPPLGVEDARDEEPSRPTPKAQDPLKNEIDLVRIRLGAGQLP